jgi:hypothetical protein
MSLFPMQKRRIHPTWVCPSATFARATPRSTAGPGAGGRPISWGAMCTTARQWTGGGGLRTLVYPETLAANYGV